MQSAAMAKTDMLNLADAEWLAHRYDDSRDELRFIHVARSEHAGIPFLTDEYLPDRPATAMARAQAIAAAPAPGPVHFIIHSAFCCSTLLAHAFDIPGQMMSLSEPVLLNDLVGWRHRARPDGRQVAGLLDQSLNLLARPFGPGEAVLLKPSNLLNPLAAAMLALRPQATAVLLHAPLKAYLGSIARKGMWGRLWVRDLLAKYLREGGFLDFGLSTEDLLKLTDIQVAALGWLAQHRMFADLAARMPDRVRTLDSERLMASPAEAVAALAARMGLSMGEAEVAAIVAGPAFNRHSKSGGAFDAYARAAEREAGLKTHAEEIDMVEKWAAETASRANIPLVLPNSLI